MKAWLGVNPVTQLHCLLALFSNINKYPNHVDYQFGVKDELDIGSNGLKLASWRTTQSYPGDHVFFKMHVSKSCDGACKGNSPVFNIY